MAKLHTLRSIDHLRSAMRLADVRTNRQLAQVTGLGSDLVGELLAGHRRRVRERTAKAIAEGLGEPVTRLFTTEPTDLRRRRKSTAAPPASDEAPLPRGARGADGAHTKAAS